MGWRTSRSVRRIWMCSNLGHPYEEIGSSQCPGIATAPPKGAIQGRDPGNSIILKPDEAFGGCDTTTAHEMSLGTAQPNLQPRIYMLCHAEAAGYIGNLCHHASSSCSDRSDRHLMLIREDSPAYICGRANPTSKICLHDWRVSR